MTEKTQAAEARRLARELARSLHFPETQAEQVAIVLTEAGNNLALHAHGGEILLSDGETSDGPYIDMLAVDRGPGMHPERCLEDGYSTAGTSGTGLGAIKRLAQAFDVFSSPSGTVIFARFQRDRVRSDHPVVGSVRVPMPGETACGDAWYVRYEPPITAVLVADGLGHGPFAADASHEAVAVFRTAPWYGAASMVENIHAALRGTRGAAVAVAALDTNSRRVRYSGLGNIAGAVLGNGRNQNMVSHNGTAGHRASKISEFEYEWPQGGALVMHSDGISTSWNLDKYPGLLRYHPAVIAGVMYRDYSRGRDDATAVVITERAL